MTDIASYTPDGRLACDVIVIDDFRDFAEGIARALRHKGMSVQIAMDGASALAFSAKLVPRVALVDCALPDIDGLTLVRDLGKIWTDTTILVLSGHVRGLSEKMACELRIRAFLNKPVPVSALTQAIEKLLREPRDINPAQGPRPWLMLGIGSPA